MIIIKIISENKKKCCKKLKESTNQEEPYGGKELGRGLVDLAMGIMGSLSKEVPFGLRL